MLRFLSSKFYLKKLRIEITWQTLYADIANIYICPSTSSRIVIQPLITWDIVKATMVTRKRDQVDRSSSKALHRSKKPAYVGLMEPNSFTIRRIPTCPSIHIQCQLLIYSFNSSIGNYIYRLAITVWKNSKKYQYKEPFWKCTISFLDQKTFLSLDSHFRQISKFDLIANGKQQLWTFYSNSNKKVATNQSNYFWLF